MIRWLVNAGRWLLSYTLGYVVVGVPVFFSIFAFAEGLYLFGGALIAAGVVGYILVKFIEPKE